MKTPTRKHSLPPLAYQWLAASSHISSSFRPVHEECPGSSLCQLAPSLVGLYLHTAQKAPRFPSSGRNSVRFLGNRLYVHLRVKILSFILEFIYFILNSYGQQIQHSTVLDVCGSFSETTCFPSSASVYWVT